jgi:hypothetical protein
MKEGARRRFIIQSFNPSIYNKKQGIRNKELMVGRIRAELS